MKCQVVGTSDGPCQQKATKIAVILVDEDGNGFRFPYPSEMRLRTCEKHFAELDGKRTSELFREESAP